MSSAEVGNRCRRRRACRCREENRALSTDLTMRFASGWIVCRDENECYHVPNESELPDASEIQGIDRGSYCILQR
jgi:hypothetical protein